MNIASQLLDLPPLVPVVGRFARGYPEHELGEVARYMPLARALTEAHSDDAHFAAYSEPTVARRLAGARVFDAFPDGVHVTLLLVDVEPPGHAKPDAWWFLAEAIKLERVRQTHPGGFVYSTRGGYRLVYRLATPVVLRSRMDADTWKVTYLHWLTHLRTEFGIAGDVACKDWTRLYRLPRVIRDGIAQEPVLIGDARFVGEWTVPAPRLENAPTTQPSASAPGSLAPATPALLSAVLQRLLEHGPAVRGERGDEKTFRAAIIAHHDYALEYGEALEVLTIWDRGNLPPRGEAELREKLDNASRYATGVYGAARAAREAMDWAIAPVGAGAPTVGGVGLSPTDAALPEPTREVPVIEILDEVEALSKVEFAPTCFANLNTALDGGLDPHSLTTLTAGTGKGKTSMILQIEAEYARSRPVLHYNGEMTSAIAVSRMIAQRLKRSWRDVRRGLVSKDDRRRALDGLDFHVVPRCTNPIESMRAAVLRALARRPGVMPILGVDYLQLLADPMARDMRLSVMAAYTALRELVEELPIACIALSQTSRAGSARLREGGGNAEDYVDTAAETAAIEQGASNALNLSFRSEDGATKHPVTMMVSKARYKGPSKIGFTFDGPIGLWTPEDAAPLSATENSREQEIMQTILAHQNKSCGGEPGTWCGKAKLTLNRLTAKGDAHRVTGNVQAVTVTLQRLESNGKIKKIDGGYVAIVGKVEP